MTCWYQIPNRCDLPKLWFCRVSRSSRGATFLSGRKYVDHCTYWHGFRRHCRALTHTSYEKISVFVSLAFLFWHFPLCHIRDFGAARLLSRPRSFWITFCADLPTCFATMSPGLTSGDVLSAVSVRILSPVRNVLVPELWRRSKRRE